VDESAEEVVTTHADARWRLPDRDAAFERLETERSVGSVLVVVPPVDAEHVLEVAAAEDEDPVEAVGADGPHPALGVGVRVGRLDGRADHGDALGAEHLVERAAELLVAVVDQESERLLIFELHDVRAC